MASLPAAPRPALRLVEASGPEAPVDPIDLDDAFRKFAPLVASVSMRILGRAHEVEDLVQDVFLEARRWVKRIQAPGAFKYWLMTVTVRAAKRRLRRRRLRSILGLEEVFDYDGVVDRSASSSQRAFIAELYRVLDQLPVGQRLAWTLRYIEGESLAEVAERCGCSLATAKRRITSAQQVISGAFGDE